METTLISISNDSSQQTSDEDMNFLNVVSQCSGVGKQTSSAAWDEQRNSSCTGDEDAEAAAAWDIKRVSKWMPHN